jgi:hypothetical protein
MSDVSSRNGHRVPVLMVELNLVCIVQGAPKTPDGFEMKYFLRRSGKILLNHIPCP